VSSLQERGACWLVRCNTAVGEELSAQPFFPTKSLIMALAVFRFLFCIRCSLSVVCLLLWLMVCRWAQFAWRHSTRVPCVTCQQHWSSCSSGERQSWYWTCGITGETYVTAVVLLFLCRQLLIDLNICTGAAAAAGSNRAAGAEPTRQQVVQTTAAVPLLLCLEQAGL
jgi:hypothetical protein